VFGPLFLAESLMLGLCFSAESLTPVAGAERPVSGCTRSGCVMTRENRPKTWCRTMKIMVSADACIHPGSRIGTARIRVYSFRVRDDT
jgi:hypothetical protein